MRPPVITLKEEENLEIYNENGSMEPEVVETIKETDKKCPACGGVMDFSPSTGKMLCPYCGTEEEILVEEEHFEAQELDFEQAEDTVSCDWGTATKAVICKSCGAQTVYDVNEIANECPYCGSNQVMEAGDSQVMAPGGVVVFKLDAKEASARFKNWIDRKFFCPKLAKESAKPRSFKGIYVPFWTYDANTFSSYTGQYGKTRQYRDRDGNVKSRTDWYGTRGYLRFSFDDVLVCGSSQQNEQMLRGIEPFDTKDVKAYRPEYLAGFAAERYTVKMKEAWETARNKMKNILQNEVESKIRMEHNTTQVRMVNVQTSYRNITYKYLLLPVWISSFQYNGKVYRFVINGQTGKVSGQTPISWPKVLLAIAAAIAVFMLLNAMMG